MAAKLTVVTAFKTEGAAESERAAKGLSREYNRLSAQLDPAIANQRRMERAQKTLDNAFAKGKITQAEYNRQLGLAREKFTEAGGGASRMSSTVADLTKRAGQLAAAMAAAAVAAAGFAAIRLSQQFLEASTTAEQLRVRLSVLLGSVEEGSRLFKEMSRFAGQVPFEYEEIMASATMLAGILRGGVSEISAWMPLIGDLAAATGFGIQETTEQVQRMLSAGASSADRFRERGVLAMLGFQAGVSYSAEQTREKLIEEWTKTESQFRGATDKLAGTWQGQVSMMSDAWFQFRLEVMEQGLFDEIKRVAAAVVEMAQDQGVRDLAKAIGQGLLPVLVDLAERVEVLGTAWLAMVARVSAGYAILFRLNADMTAVLAKVIPTEHLKSEAKRLDELATGMERVAEGAARDLFRALAGIGEGASEAAAGMGDFGGGQDAAAEKAQNLAAALDKARDSFHEQWIETKALTVALLESEESYKTLQMQLKLGTPLREALAGAMREEAEALIKAQREFESLNRLRQAEIEHAQKMFDLQMKLNAARLAAAARSEFDDRFLGDIEMPDLEPVFPAIDPESLEQMTEDWRQTVGAMSVAAEAMFKRAFENIQDTMSEALSSPFKEMIDTGSDTLDRLLKSFSDMLAQLLVMWLANLAKRVAAEQAAAAASAAAWGAASSSSGFVGGAGGGMTGALGSLGSTAAASGAFGGGGAGWMSTLTKLGPVLAVAAAWMVGNYLVERRQQKATGGAVMFGSPTNMGVAFNDDLQMSRDMKAVLDQLKATFEEIERVTGASIGIVEQAVINVKNNGRIWVTIGEALSVEVASMAEAMDLVVTQLLRSAEIAGASPAVLAALSNSVATSIEELNSEVAAALRSEELFLGIEGRTAIREKTNEFFELLEQELALGIIEAQGGSGALVGLVGSYQENFDRLMGITRDAGEVARQQAAAHNAALAMDRARLMAMRAEILATGASAQATAAAAQAAAGHAGVMVQMAEVTSTSAQMHAGLAEVMVAGAEVANANAESQAALAQTQAAGAEVALSAAEANAAALAAIDEALSALEGLEVDLDAAAAAARRAGQGGGRQGDMDRLRETLEQMRFDRVTAGMTELDAGLARLARDYEQQIALAHGNAELIGRLNEEFAFLEQQLRQQTQLAAVDTFQGFMGIGQDPFSQLRTGFDDAVSAVQDAGFGAERTARMVDRLTASYQAQLEQLSSQEFVGIGDSLMGIVDRYFSGVEGFEEFRMRLEQARFQLELGNLRARFEILKAEGNLAQAVLDQIQGVFDFIDANPIDWSEFVAPAAPAFRDVSRAADDAGDAMQRMADRLASAKERIRDFLLSLQTGALGGRSSEQMFAAAQNQFQRIRQQMQAGNIQAIEQLPEISRRFAEIARERFGSTARFQEILAEIEGANVQALGIDRVREDNVVFDQRFFQQQMQHVEVDRAGHQTVANAVTQGFALQAAEEERSREDILLELRGLRESQEALNQRLAAIEGSRRARKAS